MRAAIYTTTGEARQVLRVEDVERPEPGPGEVRVRVSLSGVNPTDVKTRAGLTPRSIDGFQVPHQDGAGTIDAVGPGVPAGRVGERVWLWMAAVGKWGTAAEWCVVPSEQAVPLPDRAADGLGACLGVPAMTAHRCLFADGPLDGAAVLVAGGAGAVGHFAIQLARRAGARVATTVSSPEKAELAAAAGADLVVNYREPDALSRLRDFAPVMDRIVEVNLGANLDLDLGLAGPSTVVVTYAATPDDPQLPVRRCMSANVTLRFILLYGVPRPDLVRAADDVTAAVAAGDLTELPLAFFPLRDVVGAQEAVESGRVGKVVVEP
ncbi:MAG TPA: NADPH:quinone reductase [Acidimicrobiales bacterium]|nr:NADPH:quinone reductase [Acidimicrobiales bacterium]